MSRYVFLSMLLLIFIAACSTSVAPSGGNNTSETKAQYTLSDVAQHSTDTDCWIVIEGKVYDVTKAIGQHPGGEAILMGCGKDGTEFFENKPNNGKSHSEGAEQALDQFYIADLKQ